MPIYNVMIEVKDTYFSNVLVEAKDYPAAMGYLKNTIEWQNDDCLDEDYAGGNHREFKIKEVKPVDDASSLPKGYTVRSIPWNGTFTVEEHFKNNENPDNV